jgi:hypothetical protein
MHFLRLLTANKIAKRMMRIYDWQDPAMYNRYRKTRVYCSCYACGHRRKWEGRTRQEMKQLLMLKDYEDTL